MSDEITLLPAEEWERNSSKFKEMANWPEQSTAKIKEQLTAGGNPYATLSSYTRDVHNNICHASSEMNPANHATMMISKLLKDYQDPSKSKEMSEAGIDKKFIKEIMEEAEFVGLMEHSQGVVDGKVAVNLSEQVRSVRNGWEQEAQREKNLQLSASVAERLEIIERREKELDSSDPFFAKISVDKQRCEADLKNLNVTKDEAKYALKQRRIAQYNEARAKDLEGQKKRTAAVQRGNIITTYDPDAKDIGGHYTNTRHYMKNENGGLTPISKDHASIMLKSSASHESAVEKGTKLDTKSFMQYAQIDYGR